MGTSFAHQQSSSWTQTQHAQPHAQVQARNQVQRQPFGVVADRSFRANSASDRSDSANEVENLLMNNRQPARRASDQGGWTSTTTGQRTRPTQQRGKLSDELDS